MRTETGKAIKLTDYRVPDYLVDQVDLNFQLHATETLVTARLRIRPNPAGQTGATLHFDGDDLSVISVSIEGLHLAEDRILSSPDALTIIDPPSSPFTLVTRTRVNPTANTQLSGLYRSNGVYCTQCEAEGFRRITYFPDRPDVLSVYTTRIEADLTEAPILLGNGNPLSNGSLGNNRHFAIWHDPHPKPSYLFALVGGNLDVLEDTFFTSSGRQVKLGIYVETGKAARASYAMDALKRSMKWDEDKFGREYDLDIFNVVAVSDFNMGAMENKGLNIFNDKYVLASPDTATDGDYAGIETVIAHEYFHNWTGNRITCRDWFQLCLKEGLTVFRDQEFSADQRSRAVRRISDVRALRAAQFVEDAGPLAHNVRPETYHEINNFYTATVYQKGAEVIRTLKNYIGDEAFRRGMDLYFEKFDGTAATVEDFMSCFAEASKKDLVPFMLWYRQAGTPVVSIASEYNSENKSLTLVFGQSIPDTPDQTGKQTHIIPIRLGLVTQAGDEIRLATASDGEIDGASAGELRSGVFVLTGRERRICFTDVEERPAISAFRQFSAPVRVQLPCPEEDYLTLAAHDSDLFNRWQAIQTYSTRVLVRAVSESREGKQPSQFSNLILPVRNLLERWEADPEFTAQALALPGQSEIAQEIGHDVDPEAIYAACFGLRAHIGQSLLPQFTALYEYLSKHAGERFDPQQAGQRALRGIVLSYMVAAGPEEGAALALNQYRSSCNMTDAMSAMGSLMMCKGVEREQALSEFFQKYTGNHLVIDKWFALQATIPDADVLDRIKSLLQHDQFSMTNPNRFRSLVSTFAMANPARFNSGNGEGYRFVADMVLDLDKRNPQIAARLLVSFRSWKMLEPKRRSLAEGQLQRIASQTDLSTDVRDIVTRSLA